MCYSILSLLTQGSQIPVRNNSDHDQSRNSMCDNTTIPSPPLANSSCFADSGISTPTSAESDIAISPDAIPVEVLDDSVFATSGFFSPPDNATTHCMRSPTRCQYQYTDASSGAQQQPFYSEQQSYPNKESHYGSNHNCSQTSEGIFAFHDYRLQQTICRVCGDIASGNHFGVQSCEACKSFFRRSIRANARYACRGSRDCIIQKCTRNRCQYCRLKKCVAMGMHKEAVQEERVPQPSNPKLQQANLPTFQLSDLNFNSPTPTSPVPTIMSQAASRMCSSLPNLKMEFELPSTSSPGMLTRVCTPTLDSEASCNISALINVDMQAKNQPETKKKEADSIKLDDLFESMKVSLFRVIEWSKHIPAFSGLSLDDQVKLLKSSWCEHCILKLAAQNRSQSDIVCLDDGVECSKGNIKGPELKCFLFRIFSELTYWVDYLNVDQVELACLKGMLLFNPDAKGLNPTSKKKVEIFQEQILQSLETRTKTMYPVSPQRFTKLLLRLAPLKAISLEVMQHMEVQRALGNTKLEHLFGELLDFERIFNWPT